MSQLPIYCQYHLMWDKKLDLKSKLKCAINFLMGLHVHCCMGNVYILQMICKLRFKNCYTKSYRMDYKLWKKGELT